MTTSSDPADGAPPDPRAGRQQRLVLALRVTLVVVFVLGMAEMVVPTALREPFGLALVVALIGSAVGRVVWLVARWSRRGDWRFAAAGSVLLGVLLAGYLLA
jgi:hypothetical protein